MLVNNWRFWVALAVSALFMLLLLYQVDLGDVRIALLEANYLYVAPAIALYFVAVYFRSLRWKYLLSPMRTFPVSRLYPVIVIGYMSNNLLPARLGELVRSYYLAQRENFNTSAALATIAVERVYDGITLLAFAAVSAPVLFLLGQLDGGGGLSRTAWVLIGGLMVALFLGALGFLTCLSVVPRFMDLVQWCTGIIPARWGRSQVQGLVLTFVAGLKVLSSPKQHMALFLFSLPVWLFEASTYFLIGYSFGIDQLFGSVWTFILVVLLLTATSNLATSLPSAIGGIGPFEVVAQQTLLAMGVGASVGAAYAGFVHLIALWLPVNLLGLALAWKQNLSIKQLIGAGDVPEPEPDAEWSGPPLEELP